MPTPSDLLNVATKELGNPGGKYWNWFFGHDWPYVNGYTTPYCACFVSWVAAQTPVTCPGFPRAVAIDRRDDFQGRMVEPAMLEIGDFVGFDWDNDRKGDHVGIVEDGDSSDISIITIEGNTDGGIVARKTRHRSSVTCGVRPRYTGSSLYGKLDVDGWAGPKTVYKLQDILQTGADGVISAQCYDHSQYRRGVLVCEELYHSEWLPFDYHGSELVRKLQSICGIYVDGDWGHDTSAALQTFLKTHGYYTGGIDSDFAHHSVVALQQSINDGVWDQYVA